MQALSATRVNGKERYALFRQRSATTTYDVGNVFFIWFDSAESAMKAFVQKYAELTGRKFDSTRHFPSEHAKTQKWRVIGIGTSGHDPVAYGSASR